MSRTFRLEKLVRDGIVPSMQSMGQTPIHRTLTKDEKVDALKAKLIEEAQESDLPDLLEVIEAWAEAEGKSFEHIRESQLSKRAKIGGFSKGIYVSAVTLSDDDKWVDYYAAEPKRFPEIAENIDDPNT